ncbi:MAG: hypothetical protein LBC98_07045 [Prevotellaceae bacterium]|jgi:acyl-ACP thioesterase|nr:hypothetical protein [Prevotellaceae bacterium]
MTLLEKDKYYIHSYHADAKQQASLSSLFCFLQESAWKHAEINDFGWARLKRSNCLWALSRMKVLIDAYPKWNDEIRLETWSKAPDALMAYRDFEIFDSMNKRILAASSAWLILDADSRRPQRMSMLQGELPILEGREAPTSTMRKLPTLSAKPETKTNIVPYSAIDMNGHVNNANYVRWTLDTFPSDFILEHELNEIEVNYLHESHIGDSYQVNLKETAYCEYLSNIVRIDDGKELVRMSLKFTKTSV